MQKPQFFENTIRRTGAIQSRPVVTLLPKFHPCKNRSLLMREKPPAPNKIKEIEKKSKKQAD